MRIDQKILSISSVTIEYIKKNWIVASLFSALVFVSISITQGFFTPIGESLNKYTIGIIYNLKNSEKLFEENKTLKSKISSLEYKFATESDLYSAYITLPNRTRRHCREFVRTWATSNGMEFKSIADPQYIFQLADHSAKVRIRCVGTPSSNNTYLVILSGASHRQAAATIFDRLGAEADGMSTRDEVLWERIPRPKFPSDDNITTTPYAYALAVTIAESAMPIEAWRGTGGIQRVIKTILPELDRNLKCKTSELPGANCSFKLGRLSATIFEPTNQENGRYDIHILVATQNFGESDVYSNKSRFFGSDFDNYISKNLPIISSKRIMTTW